MAGQLIFSLTEAADGKGLAAVEMVLSAELHGENHLAFAVFVGVLEGVLEFVGVSEGDIETVGVHVLVS